MCTVDQPPDLLSVEAAAALLSEWAGTPVSRNLLYRQIKVDDGSTPFVRRIGQRIFVSREALTRWVVGEASS
jgi:hypothetical protein